MSELNYRDIAYTNRNNRNLLDFQQEKGNISSQKEKFNEIISDIQEYIANEHEQLISEIITGKKERVVLENIIDEYLSQNNKAQGFTQKNTIKEIVDAMVGWERLQPLIDDPEVTDIFTNEQLEVIKRVKNEDRITNITFDSDEELEQFIKNIVIRTGEKINYDKCVVDAMDKIGNVRITTGIYGSPIRKREVVRAPFLTLRTYRAKEYATKEFIENGTFNQKIADFYEEVVEDSTIVIVGEPGAGKSTHLDYIQSLKDDMRRVIRIEEDAESNFKSRNSVSFEARKTSGEETRKKYDMAEFAKIATRLSGRDVVIQEVRDREAWYLFRLIDMGYNALYTIHGRSCIGGLEQTQFLMSLENQNLTYNQSMKKICDSVDFVIYLSNRKVIDIAEIKGYDRTKEEPIISYIFRLKIDEEGNFYWEEGQLSPEFKERLKLRKKLKERRV